MNSPYVHPTAEEQQEIISRADALSTFFNGCTVTMVMSSVESLLMTMYASLPKEIRPEMREDLRMLLGVLEAIGDASGPEAFAIAQRHNGNVFNEEEGPQASPSGPVLN